MGNFNSIKKELHQRIDYLNSLNIEQDTEKVYQGQLNLIDNLASISLSEDERLAYFSDHEVKQYQQKHQKFTSAWEIFLEGIMNKWLSTGKCDKNKAFLTRVKRYYLDTYKTTIDNQAKLAKIRENTKLCHVGIGDMPLSLLLFRYYTKEKIVGLDILESVIKNARQYIDNKSAQEPNKCNARQFELHWCDGKDYDYSELDVIIIAAAVKNKQEVYEQILETKQARKIVIVIRDVRDFCQYIYADSPVSINFAISQKLGETRSKVVNTSAYLVS